MRQFQRAALATLVFTSSFGAATTPSPSATARSSGTPAQASCEEASVTASLPEASDPETGLQRGRFSIFSQDPATAVTLVSPYFGGNHSDIPGSPRPIAFISGLRYESTEDGFSQELTLDWLGDLELEIGAPGCPAVAVRCNTRSCAG